MARAFSVAAALAIAAAAFQACGGSGGGGGGSGAGGGFVPITVLSPSTAFDAASSSVPERRVIDNQADYLARFPGSSGVPNVPDFAPPAVDFAREVVIVVSAGTKPTSGYSISVSSVSLAATVATITVLETSPGPGDVVLQVLTAPYQVVKIARPPAGTSFAFR